MTKGIDVALYGAGVLALYFGGRYLLPNWTEMADWMAALLMSLAAARRAARGTYAQMRKMDARMVERGENAGDKITGATGPDGARAGSVTGATRRE